MIRISTPKRVRVARGIRAAILRGDYADGFTLSKDKLAAKYGVKPCGGLILADRS